MAAWRWVVHLALTVVGVATVAALVRHAGARTLWAALSAAAGWFPVVVAIEGLRLGTDALGTRLLYGEAGRRVPLGALLHAHLVGYPLSLLLPAGRLAAEALRASLLARYVGGARAAAAAAAHQAISLFGVFVVSLPVIGAALSTWGMSAMTVGIIVQAGTAIGLGLFLQVATRRPEVSALARRLSAPLGERTGDFQRAVRTQPLFPPGAICAALVGRSLQVVQIGALAYAVGGEGTVRAGLLAAGVQLVGMAAGDLVPGQFGATDGAFALAADSLGLSVARALAVPMLVHLAQLTWAVAGLIAPFARPSRGGPRGGPRAEP